MSLISGVLFTANNFLINQWKVSVGDVVIVRTVIQMVTYTSICIARLVLIKISYGDPLFVSFMASLNLNVHMIFWLKTGQIEKRGPA